MNPVRSLILLLVYPLKFCKTSNGVKVNQKGFSILELLLVVAIVAIVPVVVVSNFPKARTQFALSAAAHAFSQTVRETQQMALSGGRYTDAFGIVQEVSGYGIYLDLTALGNATYIQYADTGNGRYDASDYIIKKIPVAADEPGIVIGKLENAILGKASVYFAVPKAEITMTGLENDTVPLRVRFAATSHSATKQVIIHHSGLVEVK